MYVCNCGARSVKSDQRVPIPADWPVMSATEAWLCATCGKPSHAVGEGSDVLRGPADANHLYSVEGLRDGVWLLHWQTPRGKITTMDYRPYPRRPQMPNPELVRESLLYKLWMLLDSKVDIISTPEPNDDMIKASARERAQSEARGLAEGIALIMYPFMDSPDAVVRAAVARYKARTAGVAHETPGLGEHMFDPSFNHDGSPRVPVARPQARTAIKAPVRTAPIKQLSEAEKESIRHMLQTKMMGPEELAKMFNVPLVTIIQLG